MYLIVIAWSYVVAMMAIAEATSSGGTLLGACVTLLLYGVLPLVIVVYLMRTPQRRRAARKAAALDASAASLDPDGSGHATSDPVTPKREET